MTVGLIWGEAVLIFSPLALGFGETCEVFRGHLSRYLILLPASMPRWGIAISAVGMDGFDQMGRGDDGRINDPTLLELKATVNTPETPGKPNSGQYWGLCKSLSQVSKQEFICPLPQFCIQRSDMDFTKIFKQEKWVSASKIGAACEASLCLRTRQNLHFGLSSPPCGEKPLLLWSLSESNPKVLIPSC